MDYTLSREREGPEGVRVLPQYSLHFEVGVPDFAGLDIPLSPRRARPGEREGRGGSLREPSIFSGPYRGAAFP